MIYLRKLKAKKIQCDRPFLNFSPSQPEGTSEENRRSRHTGGSGLGLPIALAIAQSHYSTIQVHSELGKGSTFTVRLPAR